MSGSEAVIYITLFGFIAWLYVVKKQKENPKEISKTNNGSDISSKSPINELTMDAILDVVYITILDDDNIHHTNMKSGDIIRLHKYINAEIKNNILPKVNDIIRKINTSNYIVSSKAEFDGWKPNNISEYWIDGQLDNINKYKIKYSNLNLVFKKDTLYSYSAGFYIFNRGDGRIPTSIYLNNTDNIFINKNDAIKYVKNVISKAIREKYSNNYSAMLDNAMDDIDKRITNV